MYFIPGTPVYETHKDRLIGAPAGQPSKCTPDWSRCTGKVVHYPEKLSPSQLQREIIDASRRIYSLPRLADALIHQRGIDRLCSWVNFSAGLGKAAAQIRAALALLTARL